MSSGRGMSKHQVITEFLRSIGLPASHGRLKQPFVLEFVTDDSDFVSIYDPSKVMKPGWKKQYPTVGQGVISFNAIQNNPFAIVVNEDSSTDWIALDVHKDCAFFTICIQGQQAVVHSVVSDAAGYDEGLKVSYWFSYDRDRYVLKYGKGYIMEETTIMHYDCDTTQAVKTLFNAENTRYIKMYEDVEPSKLYSAEYLHKMGIGKHDLLMTLTGNIVDFDELEEFMLSKGPGRSTMMTGLLDMQKKVSFEKNPLVTNRPYLLLDSNEITLFHLDRGGFTFSGSLSTTGRELYQNVKHVELDYATDTSKYPLSDAIRHSIKTPGCILHDKLEEKKDEFGGEHEKETYLRVTLGSSYGDSPGIPYVLEIWPAKHYSPVHNHGNAEAVIKVLFGTINVQVYNKFTPDVDGHDGGKQKRLLDFNAKAGDFTWIDRNWYQTHKLQNISDDVCATIQCYKHPSTNNIHWPYFDYISDQHQIEEFTPNSDFTFSDMQKHVMEEIEKADIK